MFRRIEVHPSDVKYQSILWRDDLSMEILILIILVLAFRLFCSLFIANRTVKQLAEDHQSTHPLGAQVARQETYMDNIVSGGHSLKDTIQEVNETLQIFALGCFHLRQ